METWSRGSTLTCASVDRPFGRRDGVAFMGAYLRMECFVLFFNGQGGVLAIGVFVSVFLGLS